MFFTVNEWPWFTKCRLYFHFLCHNTLTIVLPSLVFGLLQEVVHVFALGAVTFALCVATRLAYRFLGVFLWFAFIVTSLTVLQAANNTVVWALGFFMGGLLTGGAETFLDVPPSRAKILYVLNIFCMAIVAQAALDLIGLHVGGEPTLLTYLVAMINAALHMGCTQGMFEQFAANPEADEHICHFLFGDSPTRRARLEERRVNLRQTGRRR